MEARLHDVCSDCIETFRLLTLYLKPVLPALAGKVEEFLKARRWTGTTPRRRWARATRSASTST